MVLKRFTLHTCSLSVRSSLNPSQTKTNLGLKRLQNGPKCDYIMSKPDKTHNINTLLKHIIKGFLPKKATHSRQSAMLWKKCKVPPFTAAKFYFIQSYYESPGPHTIKKLKRSSASPPADGAWFAYT